MFKLQATYLVLLKLKKIGAKLQANYLVLLKQEKQDAKPKFVNKHGTLIMIRTLLKSSFTANKQYLKQPLQNFTMPRTRKESYGNKCFSDYIHFIANL